MFPTVRRSQGRSGQMSNFTVIEPPGVPPCDRCDADCCDGRHGDGEAGRISRVILSRAPPRATMCALRQTSKYSPSRATCGSAGVFVGTPRGSLEGAGEGESHAHLPCCPFPPPAAAALPTRACSEAVASAGQESRPRPPLLASSCQNLELPAGRRESEQGSMSGTEYALLRDAVRVAPINVRPSSRPTRVIE